MATSGPTPRTYSTATNHVPYTTPANSKVAMVLEELGLEYNIVEVDFFAKAHKEPAFLKLNPNGRLPAFVDHTNGDFTIWESNAIIQYLLDKYDPEHKLGVTEANDKHTLNQWLFFQASGQGPYFGQLFWFLRSHPEKVPSAIERYRNEILRVFGVLESVLSKQEWLVGNKFTAADLSFVSWNQGTFTFVFKDDELLDIEKQFPAFWRWHQKIIARPAVKRCAEQWAKATAKAEAERILLEKKAQAKASR
ncbi:glutathione S-transferase C-terminal-like protein [Trametes meyenii]|nr:glutathione S-transferase C-terminal-like protein [Trametes meyenii]